MAKSKTETKAADLTLEGIPRSECSVAHFRTSRSHFDFILKRRIEDEAPSMANGLRTGKKFLILVIETGAPSESVVFQP